jgi:hypothetical protein
MKKVLLAAVTAGLVGCVGGIDPGQQPGGDDQQLTAREMFEQNVYPLLSSCATCHTHGSEVGNVTGFYDKNPATAYDTATGYTAFVGDYTPQSAPILTKIAPGNHNGQMWSATEVQTITNWLNKELTERVPTGPGTDPNPPGETQAAAMLRLKNNWSSCMTLDDFHTAQMATQFGNMRANNPNNACQDCHYNGYEGFIATTDESLYFTTLSQHSAYMLQYFAYDTTGGTVDTMKIKVNTGSFLAVSQNKAPHIQHPNFNATNNQGMTALQNWFMLIQAKVAAAPNGSCGPTQLVD